MSLVNGVTGGFHTAVNDFIDAVRGGVGADMAAADQRMRTAYQDATPAELTQAANPLVAILNEVPPLARGQLAVLIGACVEYGADPVACAPRVLANLARNLEHAATFARQWSEIMDIDLPDPEEEVEVPFTELFEVFDPVHVMAWWTQPDWERSGLAMLQRPAVRKRLGPIRALLQERHDSFAEVSGRWNKCLDYVLRVLDDEPLVVLHRETGTAYRMRMSGMGDNFQLHTLLAHELIGGGYVAGEAPADDAVAACRDAEGMVPTVGSFNLVSPSGEWIWNEGTPSDIPLVEGVRLLVLDPPPYRRHWPAGRFFPYMPGDLALEEVLPAAAAATWFAHVEPADRSGKGSVAAESG
ncbi:hypothetical protein GCM10027088_26020 [Nocardia goodfellowii]